MSELEGFEKYIETLRTELPYVEDESFAWSDVVSILIILLRNTDSLNKANEASNATQIQITSERTVSDGMRKTEDFFPTLTLNSTFKSWKVAIPVRLNTKNIEKLGGNTSSEVVWLPDQVQIRRRLLNSDENGGGNPTLHICYGNDIMPLREILTVDDYLVFAKRKNQEIYEAFGVKKGIDLGTGKNMYSSSVADKDSTSFGLERLVINRAKFGTNRIYYGAPGCGKSRHVSDMLAEVPVSKDNIIRVTFHPEYANCDFIGQILPTVETKKDEATGEEKEIVKYIFNPGPFTLALQKAYDTNEMVFLIVEEINRGNAAAIFGDMFQLLDRVRDSSKPNYCASEYPVNNPNMQKYLIDSITDDAIKAELKNGIFIPSNLTIYATMNSSDQNVFTLDTAFKRRWSFEQISNDITKDTDHAYKGWYVPGTEVTWADFLIKLNLKILEYKLQNQTNEDKRLGKYFVTKDCLVDPANIPGNVSEIAQNFAYKVLEYVWNDVCKIGREEWFDTENYKTLEDLIDAFVNPKEGEKPLSVFQNITF